MGRFWVVAGTIWAQFGHSIPCPVILCDFAPTECHLSGTPREIPLDDVARATLKELPSRFQKGYVFPSPKTGGRLADIKKQFGTAVKKAGVGNGVVFHTARHTFASHLVMNGVDLKTVQELLGHATTRMTERYSHLSPDHKTRAVKILDSAFQTGTKTDTVVFQPGTPSGKPKHCPRGYPPGVHLRGLGRTRLYKKFWVLTASQGE